jgi:YggT family protein
MPEVLKTFILLLVWALWLLLLARVLISWVMPRGGGAVVAFIYQATEPLLAPIRRILPPTAGLDWSPLIALIILWLISNMVEQI